MKGRKSGKMLKREKKKKKSQWFSVKGGKVTPSGWKNNTGKMNLGGEKKWNERKGTKSGQTLSTNSLGEEKARASRFCQSGKNNLKKVGRAAKLNLKKPRCKKKRPNGRKKQVT